MLIVVSWSLTNDCSEFCAHTHTHTHTRGQYTENETPPRRSSKLLDLLLQELLALSDQDSLGIDSIKHIGSGNRTHAVTIRILPSRRIFSVAYYTEYRVLLCFFSRQSGKVVSVVAHEASFQFTASVVFYCTIKLVS